MTTNGVQTRLWRDGRVVEEDFPLERLSDLLAEDGALVWGDLCEPDHERFAALAEELCLDRHAVEDAVAQAERPKATRHRTHTFVTVYATKLEATGDLDDLGSRLVATRISAFVLPRGVVTVRQGDQFDLAPVLQRWEDNSDLLTLGPAALLHGLLDVVVDGHFETIQQLDEAIEALEDGLFDDGSSTREIQQRTYRVRKELVQLRRIVLPMREVVNAVVHQRDEHAGDGNELDGWYSDLYDHVIRAAEWTESLRDMVSTVFETNLSLQDARLNTVMKKLTGWAAIIAVPTAVTGWFGQNVPYPGFGSPYGVVATSVIILGLGVGLYVAFRRKGWL